VSIPDAHRRSIASCSAVSAPPPAAGVDPVAVGADLRLVVVPEPEVECERVDVVDPVTALAFARRVL
jgi:hypothetical protein